MYDKDPVFTRLRKLELEVTPDWSDELYCLASLIKASPLLHHFKLMVIE